MNEALLQITDNGPVKVLARGHNAISDLYEHNNNQTNTSSSFFDPEAQAWDKWNEFPTVVQVGDLVWAWKDVYRVSTSTFNGLGVFRWTLVDIVVNKGGKNIAYPPVTNNIITTSTAQYNVSNTGLADLQPPVHYLNVTQTDSPTKSHARNGDMKVHDSTRGISRVYPQFEGSDITRYLIRHRNASNDGQYVNGLGGKINLLKEDSSLAFAAARIFPPIRYQWQFEELYGKDEFYWGERVETGYDIWTDEYPRGVTTSYPYEFEEPSESLFRDVAGDNTGDGNDDSKLVVAAVAATLDVSKCGLDINTSGLNDGINSLKDSIKGAVDSSGLSALASKAGELKDSLVANLPQLPELPDFSSQLSALDITDSKAVAALREKWGDIVTDFDSIIDNLKVNPTSFDPCSIKDIKAEVNEDGSLSKVEIPTPPIIPKEKPPEIEKTAVVIEEAAKETQSFAEEKFGVTAFQGMEGLLAWNATWQALYQDARLINLKPTKAQVDKAREDLKKLKTDADYLEFKRLVNEKRDYSDYQRFIDAEETYASIIVKEKQFKTIDAQAIKVLSNLLKNSAAWFYQNPTSDYPSEEVLKRLTKLNTRRLGEKLLEVEVIQAVFDEDLQTAIIEYTDLINKIVGEYVWREIIIKGYTTWAITKLDQGTVLTDKEPTYYNVT